MRREKDEKKRIQPLLCGENITKLLLYFIIFTKSFVSDRIYSLIKLAALLKSFFVYVVFAHFTFSLHPQSLQQIETICNENFVRIESGDISNGNNNDDGIAYSRNS